MYRLLVGICILALTFTETLAAGQFTQPSGSDGSNTIRVGDTINIAWTGVAQYPIFSLGILSTTNGTISWFIVNSRARPTSYRWNVDVERLGFDISSSRLFQFYACNGSNAERSAFTLPFKSVLFNIGDAATAVTTSSVTSASATLSPTSQTSSTTNEPSATSSTTQSNVVPFSSSLSVGAKAGIGIAVALGAIGAISALIWLLSSRRRKNPQQNKPAMIRNELAGDGPIIPHAHLRRWEYYTPRLLYKSAQTTFVHEAPSQNVVCPQLYGDERHYGGRPAELAG